MSDPLNKLAKICGMFGSEHVGERAAAAAQAEALRVRLGVSWDELLKEKKPSRLDAPELDAWSMTPASLAGAFEDVITDWEMEFLISLSSRRSLSEKQKDVLHRIRKKCADWTRGQEARSHAA